MPVTTIRTDSQATVAQKLTMGAVTGSLVGASMGLLFGTYAVLRGASTKGFFGTVGPYMGTSGLMFGFFMAIGAVIRTDGSRALTMEEIQAYQRYTHRENHLLHQTIPKLKAQQQQYFSKST